MFRATEKIFIYGIYVLLIFLPFQLLMLWIFPGYVIVTYWKEIVIFLMLFPFFFSLMTNAGYFNIIGFVFIFLYMSVAIVRTAWDYFDGQDRYLIFYGLYNYIYYILLAFMANSIDWNKKKLESFFKGIVYIISIISFFALLDWIFELNRQIEWGDIREGLLGSWHVGEGYRAYLGTDNPMELGLFCSTGQVICLYFILEIKEKSLIKTVVNWFCFFACAVGTLVTLSRGPLIANITSSCYLLFFRDKHSKLKTHVDAFVERSFLIIVAGLIFIAAIIALSDYGTISHFGAVLDWSEDKANVARVRSWEKGFEKFQERPVWGNGIGFTQTRLDKYRRLTLNWDDTFISEGFLFVLAVEGGIFFLGSFLLVTLNLGWIIYKHTIYMQNSWQIFVLLGALFILFYTEALIMPIFDTRTFSVLFWTIYGISLKLAYQNIINARWKIYNNEDVYEKSYISKCY